VAERGGVGDLGDFMGGGGSSNDPSHAQVYVGGITGGTFFGFSPGVSGNIKDCSSRGDITAVAGGNWAFAAGIAGCFQGDASQGGVRMENCVAGGTISAASEYAYAGGMTCYGDGGAVYYRCTFVGAIKPGNYYTTGPITGQYGSVIECDWSAATAPEPAPQAALDLSGKLSNLVPNLDYAINGVVKQADSSGKITIEEAWFGTTVAIIKKKSNVLATADSPPQSLAVPARAAAPTGLAAGPNFISGVNASMEWAPFGTDNWASCAGSSVANLAPGTYYVRYKQTNTAFASANAALAVSLNITSAEDLAKIGADPSWPVNGAYVLEADLYLNNWTPLTFAGSFNGNNHRITVESFNPAALSSLKNIGLFSTITGPLYDAPVVIENLNIAVGANACLPLGGLAPDGVGALAGKAEYVLLRNITVDGTIMFNANDGYQHTTIVGGVVGQAVSSSLADCRNSAAITVGASIVGGVAGTLSGQASSPALIERCSATGSIATSASGSTTGANVGGVAGRTSGSAAIKRSYYAGSIAASWGDDGQESLAPVSGVGGVAGLMDLGGLVENSYSSGSFAVTGSSGPGKMNNGVALGGVVGLQRGQGAVIQRCYSSAALSVQRNSKAYAGGILGFANVTGGTAQITRCAALNSSITVECASGGEWALHRVLGGKTGNPALTRNIAWYLMPLAAGQPPQPCAEQSADISRNGVAGDDEDPRSQQNYAADPLGWDFNSVWQMGGSYPELR
jgi:hypothetical protein